MSDFGGILQSTGFQLNSSRPLDLKTMCTTTERLNLTFVQRFKSMLVLDIDDDKWYMLDNNPATDFTVTSDWIDAGIGGAGAMGIYVEVVTIGDTEGPVTITHDLNNDYVHVSAYLMPTRKKMDCQVTITGANTIQVEGYGDSESVMFIIGQGGGSSFAQAKQVTYAEMETLINTNGLLVGNWYLITDFQTKNDAGFGTLNTAPVEPLYTQAIATNGIARRVYSQQYFNEIIYYDFNNNSIAGGTEEGYWETGVDQGEFITISSVTATSFQIGYEPVMDNDFELEVEDDSGNYYYYGSGDEGTGFTVTDLGGGVWQIDILDQIHLDDPAYNYIWLSQTILLGSRPGYIEYRENTDKNIKCAFDFRGCQWVRRKLDVTGISAWNSSTAYVYGDKVTYNNSIWVSMYDNTNSSPNTGNSYWIMAVDEYDINYSFVSDYIAGSNYPTDPLTNKLFYAFSLFNKTTEAVSFHLDSFRDIEILSENVVFKVFDANANVYSNKIGVISSKCTLNNIIRSCEFGDGSTNLITLHSSYLTDVKATSYVRNTFIRTASKVNLEYLDGSILQSVYDTSVGGSGNMRLRYVTRGTIGRACYDLRLGSSSYDIIGTTVSNVFWRQSNKNVVGNGMRNVFSECPNFKGNIIGNDWVYFIISSGAYKWEYNVLGNNVGKSGTYFTAPLYWARSEIGSFVFWYGTSNLAGALSDAKIGSNTLDLNIGSFLFRGSFGNVTQHVTIGAVVDATFEDNCQNIDIAGQVTFCHFERGVMSVTCASTNAFQYNRIKKLTSLNFGTSATHIHGDYPCDIYRRPDNTARLSYINDSDVLTVVDPTT